MKEYKVKCTYCNKEAKLVTGEKIYPHRRDLYYLKFYSCNSCDAYVGCHKKGWNSNGIKPLGTLANAELRAVRSLAHKHFDPIWKDKIINRTHAYQLLSAHMGTKFNDTHIAMFNVKQCKEVLEFDVINIEEVNK